MGCDYWSQLKSPVGNLTLRSNGQALTGLWIAGQKYFPADAPATASSFDDTLFGPARDWLEAYFQGEDPGPTPPLAPPGTPFQMRVWEQLTRIPYGATRTYGELAQALRTSPRALGGAVGRNPISILIPCHRVVGTNGSLTGYAGGLTAKTYLLKLESNSGGRLPR